MLATGLSCLVVAAVLGGVLVHDGEVGIDDARLDALQDGDEVRLKGTASPARADAPGVLNHTIRLTTPEGDVFVTADQALPTEGTWIVVGTVLSTDGALLVAAHEVHEPLLFG